KTAVDQLAAAQPEHGVPQELQAFVGRRHALLERERPVGEGGLPQRLILEPDPKGLLQGGGSARQRERPPFGHSTSRTCRPAYHPQFSHTRCGSFGWWHWGHSA